MTSDLPPLSKTHPTIWDNVINDDERAEYKRKNGCVMVFTERQIRESTVDRVEHEGVKRLYCHYMAEVERLKKELKDAYSGGVETGIREGERRAMQRVKEIINQYGKTELLLNERQVLLEISKLTIGLSDKDEEEVQK